MSCVQPGDPERFLNVPLFYMHIFKAVLNYMHTRYQWRIQGEGFGGWNHSFFWTINVFEWGHMVGTTPSPFCPGPLRPPSFSNGWLRRRGIFIYIYVCVPAPLLNLWKQMVDYIGNHGSMTGRDPSKVVNESHLWKFMDQPLLSSSYLWS